DEQGHRVDRQEHCPEPGFTTVIFHVCTSKNHQGALLTLLRPPPEQLHQATPDVAVSGWRSMRTLVCNGTSSSADGVPIDIFVKLFILRDFRQLATRRHAFTRAA